MTGTAVSAGMRAATSTEYSQDEGNTDYNRKSLKNKPEQNRTKQSKNKLFLVCGPFGVKLKGGFTFPQVYSPQINSKMSSTLRLYINDTRISTAVPIKSGQILQVYPVKTTFVNEVAWRQHWDEATKPKIVLKIGDVEPKPVSVSAAAVAALTAARAAHGPLPSRSKKTIPASEMIFNTLVSAAVPVAPVVAKPKNASLDDWTVTLKNKFNHILPAGTYYIGDLCYVLGNDVYDNIFGGTGYGSGIYEEKNTGRAFLVAGTAYGDGMYVNSDMKDFAVDAGIIGICSHSLMAKNDGGGHVYTFAGPVECDFNDGRFFFNSGTTYMVIDTTGDDDGY